MQKDVVDRILSKEGSSNAGALSVRMQLLSKIKRICDVPPSSFSPPPKVFSSLVVFEPIKNELRLDIGLENIPDRFKEVAENRVSEQQKNIIGKINRIVTKQVFPISAHLNTTFYEKKTIYID